MLAAPALVPLPGRGCGTCTACCTHLEIDDSALRKSDGVACPHLAGAGCGIYAARPATCAAWHCGWRVINLPDALRPDRSGVLLVPELSESPGYAAGGLRFAAIAADPAVLLADGIVDFMGQCVARGVPVFVSIGEGARTRRLLLNPDTEQAVRAGDRARFLWMLRGIVAQLAAAGAETAPA